MGVCRVLNWTKEVTCDCFVMFFDVFFCVLVCRLHLFGTGKVTFVEEVLPCLILGAAKRKDVIFCRVPCLSMLFW